MVLRKNSQPPATLIATLGSEAQVITATYALLQQQSERISCLEVIHTTALSDTPTHDALQRLRIALQAIPQLTSSFYPLLTPTHQPLLDVNTETAARAAFQLIYQRVYQAKQAATRVHLSIAGGRKTMAVFGMAAAQLLFDEDDCLWHLYSTGEFLASKRLWPQPGDEVHLIPVPVLTWSRVSPMLAGLRTLQDPFEALEHVKKLKLTEKMEQSRQFFTQQLTPAEQKVVTMLVIQGDSDQEIGRALHLSPRTIEQHLRSAYQKAADHWQLMETPGRTQLVSLLSYFLTIQENTGKSA